MLNNYAACMNKVIKLKFKQILSYRQSWYMKYLLAFLLLLLFSCGNHHDNVIDIIIRNGKILDGTGNSWYYADVAVKDGRIIKIDELTGLTATREIDATGMYVSPGFIDVHTHIEGDETANPTADNFIYDGVTTVVTGNCGSSVTDFNSYFSMLDDMKLSVNVASLIGHNDI